MKESPERSEARAHRALAAVVASRWRVGPTDRVTLRELAGELETSQQELKRALICTALIQVAGEWHDSGQLIDEGNIFDWFERAIRAARARLHTERTRVTFRQVRRQELDAQLTEMMESKGEPSPLDVVLAIERDEEHQRELESLLDSGPAWIGTVYELLDRKPWLSFEQACHEGGVPLSRVRVFRHRHRRRGPDGEV